MSKSHAVAIAALEIRISELSSRLAHAKLSGDQDKVLSLERKLSRAMGQLTRLRRKAKQ